MKTVKVSFEISEERLLECLKIAGDHSGLEFSEDVANYIDQDLAGFIEEGLNQDLYQDHFNWKNEDED